MNAKVFQISKKTYGNLYEDIADAEESVSNLT